MRTARPERWIVAVAIACCGLPAIGAELGTLFHTAEERARLDRLRRGETPPEGAAQATPGAREVTGFVKRSDGRGTVWIDGVPVQANTPRARALLDPKSVRGSSRDDNALRIERLPPR